MDKRDAGTYSWSPKSHTATHIFVLAPEKWYKVLLIKTNRFIHQRDHTSGRE